jgi:hypothetical protein
MKQVQSYWHLLLGITLGLGLGLVISWKIAPQNNNSENAPSRLREDYKDTYRALIAASYAANGDLPRAKNRLAALNDPNDVETLKMQAQRTLAEGNDPKEIEALAALAADLSQEISATQVTATSTRFITQTPRIVTPTGSSSSETVSTPPTSVRETPLPTLTPIPFFTRTQPAIATPSQTPRAPYVLQTQDEICSTNLSEGLLMVYVSDAHGKALPGVEIIVSWEGNEEHFFTGLKPELGEGYADFTMQPNKTYALHLAAGSTAASNLYAPSCEDKDGNHYWGSLRLKYQQP